MLDMTLQAERVSIARSRLFQQAPWFGAMSLNLKVSANNPTKALMATDGTTLFYTPARVAVTSDAELIGVWAHEVMHCALLHPFREGTREHHMWNEACDYAINSIVLKQFKLPSYALHNPEYDNLSAEQIYAVLYAAKQKEEQAKQEAKAQQDAEDSLHPEQEDEEDDACDSGQSDIGDDTDNTDDNSSDVSVPDASGKQDEQAEDETSASEDTTYDNDDVIPAPKGGNSKSDSEDGSPSQDESETGSNNEAPSDATETDRPMTELDWQIAAEQAEMVAAKAGVMSADVSRTIANTRQPKTDPWAILRQFVESRANTDYSWNKPSKRMLVTAGLYMPGIVSDEMPPIAVAIDTSGSVGPELLRRFAQELTTILNEYKPRELHVIYCDSTVRHTESFFPGDDVTLHARGGGGTAFAPVFKHIAEAQEGDLEADYSEISCLIYLTDLMGSDNHSIIEPSYPVLWATPAASRMRPPWGEYVELDIA